MPQDGTFVRSRLAERALPSQRLISSDGLGWRTLLARSYRDPARTEAFSTAQSPDLLVVFVVSGTYVIESRKGRFWRRATYGPGAVGVTAPGNVSVLRWHSTSTQPLESLHVHLAAELLDETFQHLGGGGQPVPDRFPDTLLLEDSLVTAAGQMIGRALRHGAPGPYADSLAQMLATHLLYRTVLEARPVTPAARPAVLGPAQLGRVTGYMREHLRDEVSLDDLAGQANVSKYHFLRMFTRSTGVTPHRYLVRMRLRHAADLLRDTDQTVLQVSLACGYRSPGQFAAAFRREYGVSPSRFRAG
ncbi:AraC family transcriptional regulator [Micromonospora sp. NPDC049559]|uniref:AraC family transcriptional regulator n=1 Tax=Micromonospora sp. NPDC049559 TaxID=3155923 RepID=UPI0034317F63